MWWILIALVLIDRSRSAGAAPPPLAHDIGATEIVSTPIPSSVLRELNSSGFQPISPGSNVAGADQSGHDVVSRKLHGIVGEGPSFDPTSPFFDSGGMNPSFGGMGGSDPVGPFHEAFV